MASTAYCGIGDLLLGEIPLPGYLSPDKYVQDAADEIDSKIGHLYKTPVDLEAPDLSRTAKLTLKRINAHLASGRLLLAVAAPDENRQLNAYGLSLVKEAIEALALIATGEYPLDGAEGMDGDTEMESSAPKISNLDPESSVEAFYDRIANPDFVILRPGVYYGGRG